MNELRLPEMFDLDPLETSLRNFMRPWRFDMAERAPTIKIDLTEQDDHYLVKADIPGVRKEDIDVRVDGTQVTISAQVRKEKESKKDDRILRSERQFGFASRSFALASPVDEGKAQARYENGVLDLKLPKKANSSQRRLEIA